MLRILIAFCSLLRVTLCFGQLDVNYSPAPILDTISPEMSHVIQKNLEKDKARITEPKAQINSFLKSLYDKRYEYLIKTINDDQFILDEEFTPYLTTVLNRIYDANPQLPRETRVYALRSNAANAVSFGDGTLGFTLALLARMESEDQIAFVLCHEIAHYHSEHAVKDLTTLARLNYDKELKKKLDAIKKNPYGQYTRLTEVFKQMGLSLNHHSRVHEYEADSLGLLFFNATSYRSSEAIRVMEILDSVDTPSNQHLINFRKNFEFKEFPYKESWESYQKSTTWHAGSTEPDSLRTHPECKKRIVALQRQIQGLQNSDQPKKNVESKVSPFQKESEFELIESAYHFHQFGEALFRSLLLIEDYPQNIYLQAMIGKSLYMIFKNQQNHTLGKVIELPDPRFPENYDRFLTFIHKLRLTEISSLAYYYMTTRPESSYSDEAFIYALWLCSRLQMSSLDPDKVRDEYINRFPNGKFLIHMKY